MKVYVHLHGSGSADSGILRAVVGGRRSRPDRQDGLTGGKNSGRKCRRKEVREGFRNGIPRGMILPCIRRGYLHKMCSDTDAVAPYKTNADKYVQIPNDKILQNACKTE